MLWYTRQCTLEACNEPLILSRLQCGTTKCIRAYLSINNSTLAQAFMSLQACHAMGSQSSHPQPCLIWKMRWLWAECLASENNNWPQAFCGGQGQWAISLWNLAPTIARRARRDRWDVARTSIQSFPVFAARSHYRDRRAGTRKVFGRKVGEGYPKRYHGTRVNDRAARYVFRMPGVCTDGEERLRIR